MTQIENLRKVYSGLSTERLVAIVTVDASQYEISAVEIALEELKGRGVDPMYPPEDIRPTSEVDTSSTWGFVPTEDDEVVAPTSRLGAWLYLGLTIFLLVLGASWTGADKTVALSTRASAFGVLVAIGLFRRSGFLNWTAKTWRYVALYILIATILGVGVIPAFIHPSLFGFVLAVIVAVLCLGVLGTVERPPLEPWRAAAGVACFVFGATCLVAASQAAWPFQGLAIDAAIRISTRYHHITFLGDSLASASARRSSRANPAEYRAKQEPAVAWREGVTTLRRGKHPRTVGEPTVDVVDGTVDENTGPARHGGFVTPTYPPFSKFSTLPDLEVPIQPRAG